MHVKLLKSKILIFILLTGFIAAPLSGAICDISHEKTEIPPSEELNRIEKHSGNYAINNFNIQNGTDDCEDPGISIFIVNFRNDQYNFYKQALISPNLISIVDEHFSEKKFVSKFTGKISSSPTKILYKLYRLNSLFLI